MATYIAKHETVSLSSVKRKIETSGKFLITHTGKTLRLSRIYNGKEMCCQLSKQADKNLLDLNLNYEFVSKVSHFDYRKSENRLCRNKTTLGAFINDLKKAEVWNMIDKSFLHLNENRKTMPTKKLAKELDSLLNG